MSERKVSYAGATDNALVWATLLVVVSVVFGGGSRDNPLRLALVEIASLPLLYVGVMGLVREGGWRGTLAPLILMGLVILLPLVQLVPLPPDVWTRLETHAPVRDALVSAGLPLDWRPLSLAPQETWRSAMALVPPAAMLLGALRLQPVDARLLAALWVVLALISVILGAFQVMAPTGSGLFLYDITNEGAAVGFFANRNHQASLLLALMPLAAMHAADVGRRQGARGLIPMLAWAYFLIALVALGAVRSRAGLILAGPALVGALAVVWRAVPRGSSRRRATLVLAGGAAAAIAGVMVLVLAPTLQRFGADPNSDQRARAWPHVAEAAQDHAPLGAGIGAFDRVYRAAEPLDLVQPTYLNHVHNDYLEIWLEAGWPGLALVAAVLLWVAQAGISAWRAPRDDHGDARRAASVAVLLLAAHSFVDYPLRTEALMVLMAFCCGVLAWGGRDAAQRAP